MKTSITSARIILYLSAVLLTACATGKVSITGKSKETIAAIAAHRDCAARNLDVLLATHPAGTSLELAEAAERLCGVEREAIRTSAEDENNANIKNGLVERSRVQDYIDFSVRQIQADVIRALVIAQTWRK